MTHRSFNEMLTVFVVILALYIILAPMIPQLDYLMNGASGLKTPPAFTPSFDTQSDKSSQNITNSSADASLDNNLKGDSRGTVVGKSLNQLYIPSIGASAAIIEGTRPNTVDKGLWRRPNGSVPGEGGNTIIVGHRFSYNHGVVQPFYHLDKVRLGDSILVQWQGRRLSYYVTDKKVVTKYATDIESPTSSEQITLYTCTPIWNPVDRLVLIAKPKVADNE